VVQGRTTGSFLTVGLDSTTQTPANGRSEGCPVSEFPPDKQQAIINLFIAFNEYYPEPVLYHRLMLFKKYMNETYFAWIGEFGDEDPYYYRIHSPVAFMELDFHCGSKLRAGMQCSCILLIIPQFS
jgi:hypothetical protein